MSILYLLDRPELGGGVKVVFQHAALLAEAGEEVTVRGRGPLPDWGRALLGSARYVDAESGSEGSAGVDLVVATYWTTLAEARAALTSASGPRARAAVQLLQGYEPDWPHQSHRADEIGAAYRAAALPAWVVARHLGERLAGAHGLPWFPTPPPLDPRFRPRPLRLGPRRRPWVVVPGIFEAEVKGVEVGLEAVRRLREGGVPCRLLRLSVLPSGEAERTVLEADRFLAGAPPEEIAGALREADLVVFPARAGEGFGLPLLEAMASGVPAVASRLPSTTEMVGDALPLVEPDDVDALVASARRLLGAPREWRRARRAGLVCARRYRPELVRRRLVDAVAWAMEQGRGVARERPADGVGSGERGEDPT